MKNCTRYLQIFFRSIMWAFALSSIFVTFLYFMLVLLWMILGAILNPNSFLPYATAAATFIVIVFTKYQFFTELAETGLKKVRDFVLSKETD